MPTTIKTKVINPDIDTQVITTAPEDRIIRLPKVSLNGRSNGHKGSRGKNGGGPGNNGPRGGGGNSGDGGGSSSGGGDRDDDKRLPPRSYWVAMWIALASILMLFTTLASAYIVRAGIPNRWQPIAIPRLLWFSTLLIVLSSLTFEMARRSLKRQRTQAYSRWLLFTALLGVGFLTAQLLSWRQLLDRGIYLASNPHSSFFYFFTGAHGLHLLGGILAVTYLLFRALQLKSETQTEVRRRATVAAVIGLYWHFMDGLWICLFSLLLFT